VWNGSYSSGAPQGEGELTDFCIHTDHPDLNSGNSTTLESFQQPTITSTSASYPTFVHAHSFERDSSVSNAFKQARYCGASATDLTIGNRYPVKLGYYTNDRYLIGRETCGSYLYMCPSSYADILVEGTDYRSVRTVEFGDDNAIEIPLIFQFRMTDYYGVSNTGTGRIGGLDNLINLNYAKKIGIDINVKDESTFSFDIQISAKYKADTPSQISSKPVKTAVSFVPDVVNYFDRYTI
jgi:hypothetical protein